ncbi:MAG: NUDIX hydrolase [Chloroflexota bacterium]|nr:NUDIX hydrolase [Chloroflexota bacterium]
MCTIHAIAVVIANPLDDSLFLTVRRPYDDVDLPGIWGLPATVIKHGESPHTAAQRIATLKLGGKMTLGVMLAEGTQERATQHLVMSLYAATLGSSLLKFPNPTTNVDGVTYYIGWKWASIKTLTAGAQMGSLCCQLALETNLKESV